MAAGILRRERSRCGPCSPGGRSLAPRPSQAPGRSVGLERQADRIVEQQPDVRIAACPLGLSRIGESGRDVDAPSVIVDVGGHRPGDRSFVARERRVVTGEGARHHRNDLHGPPGGIGVRVQLGVVLRQTCRAPRSSARRPLRSKRSEGIFAERRPFGRALRCA